MKKVLRQGDWSFYKIDEAQAEKIKGEEIKLAKNEFTFAEGEASGHFHTLHTPKLEDMKWKKLPDGSYIVTLKKDGHATHPQHSLKGDLVVPAGTYNLRQLREKEWFSLTVRKIKD